LGFHKTILETVNAAADLMVIRRQLIAVEAWLLPLRTTKCIHLHTKFKTPDNVCRAWLPPVADHGVVSVMPSLDWIT